VDSLNQAAKESQDGGKAGRLQQEEVAVTKEGAEVPDARSEAPLFRQQSGEDEGTNMLTKDQHSQHQDGMRPRPDATGPRSHTAQAEAEEIPRDEKGGTAPCGQDREAQVDRNLAVSDNAEALAGAAAAAQHSHGAHEQQPVSQERPGIDEPAPNTEAASVPRAEPQAEESTTASSAQDQKEEARWNTEGAETAETQTSAESRRHPVELVEEGALARAAADEDETDMTDRSQAQHSQHQDGARPRPDATEHGSHTAQAEAEEIPRDEKGGTAPCGQDREAQVDANLVVSDNAEALAGAAAAAQHSHGAHEQQPVSQERPGIDEPAPNTEAASVPRAEPQAEESSTAASGQAQNEAARWNTAGAETAETQTSAESRRHPVELVEEGALARAAADEDETDMTDRSQAQHSQHQDGTRPRPDATEHGSHTAQAQAEEIPRDEKGGTAPFGQDREAQVDANLVVSDNAEALAGAAAATLHSHGAHEQQPLSQELPSMDDPIANAEVASAARAEPQAEESSTAASGQAQNEAARWNTAGAETAETQTSAESRRHPVELVEEGALARTAADEDETDMTDRSQAQHSQHQDGTRPRPDATEHGSHTAQAEAEEIPRDEKGGTAPCGQDREAQVDANLVVSDNAAALAGAAAAALHSHGAHEQQPLLQELPSMDDPIANAEVASAARAEPQAEESSTAASGQAQNEAARWNTAGAETAETQTSTESRRHPVELVEEGALARTAADEDETDVTDRSQAQHSQHQDGTRPRPDATEHGSHTAQAEAEEIPRDEKGGTAPCGQDREAQVDHNLVVSDNAEALVGDSIRPKPGPTSAKREEMEQDAVLFANASIKDAGGRPLRPATAPQPFAKSATNSADVRQVDFEAPAVAELCGELEEAQRQAAAAKAALFEEQKAAGAAAQTVSELYARLDEAAQEKDRLQTKFSTEQLLRKRVAAELKAGPGVGEVFKLQRELSKSEHALRGMQRRQLQEKDLQSSSSAESRLLRTEYKAPRCVTVY
ncbi:unnamed protein product, partial [Symbiodinium necroappetens]